jgi:hypothetical protein
VQYCIFIGVTSPGWGPILHRMCTSSGGDDDSTLTSQISVARRLIFFIFFHLATRFFAGGMVNFVQHCAQLRLFEGVAESTFI